MDKKFHLENMDPMVLAFAALVQPCSAEEAYNFGKSDLTEAGILKSDFLERFKALEHARYMWRTEEGRFILTDKGLRCSELSIPKKKRDNLRVFCLKDIRNR